MSAENITYENGQWYVVKHRRDEAPAVSSKTLKIDNIEWTIDEHRW